MIMMYTTLMIVMMMMDFVMMDMMRDMMMNVVIMLVMTVLPIADAAADIRLVLHPIVLHVFLSRHCAEVAARARCGCQRALESYG